ncbi:DUF6011 domain-containing protein [Streptomyces chilikensis]|uniref:DUF6011 domain-containing protein n=1 Tax=Streptomyces chilikensis TaxID=1194079 RepID=A0ABV3EJA3_9ACTN
MQTPATVTYSCCLRCGRPLTSKKSRARGYGAACYALVRLRIRLTTGTTPAQRAKALELVTDGAILPLRMTSAGLVCQVVSEDGEWIHLTTPTHCSCPHGRRSTSVARCYHTVVAGALAASLRLAV